MIGRLQRWGNSLAVRIPKEEVERLGLGEGSTVDLTVRSTGTRARVDISDRPTYRDSDPDLSLKIDEILYGEG